MDSNGFNFSLLNCFLVLFQGCGNDEYNCEEKGATFLGGNMPAECPDLSKHNSFFSENMSPELYNKLKDKKTKLGVTLGHCIKTGVDNPGKPFIIIDYIYILF